jgi:hypothetical protein
MLDARRKFLWCAAAMLSGTVLELPAAGQNPKHGLPTPPEAADPQAVTAGEPRNRIPSGAAVREHEKAFRDCLTALSGRVNRLNQEVEGLHSADVFSVGIYKQTGEIEKLAKQLKNLAKG